MIEHLDIALRKLRTSVETGRTASEEKHPPTSIEDGDRAGLATVSERFRKLIERVKRTRSNSEEILQGVLQTLETQITVIWRYIRATEGCADALREVVTALPLLEQFVRRCAVRVFGRWGLYWFEIATESPNGRTHFQAPPETRAECEKLARILLAVPLSESDQEWADGIAERDTWIYEQVVAGVKYRTILRELRTKPPKWGPPSTIPGIKKIAKQYAIRNGLPLPEPRLPGRPRGS